MLLSRNRNFGKSKQVWWRPERAQTSMIECFRMLEQTSTYIYIYIYMYIYIYILRVRLPVQILRSTQQTWLGAQPLCQETLLQRGQLCSSMLKAVLFVLAFVGGQLTTATPANENKRIAQQSSFRTWPSSLLSRGSPIVSGIWTRFYR